MSIQPIFAVAFSSVPAMASAVSSAVRRSAAVSAPSITDKTDKTANTDTNSRDSGKPLSASGDVLDLSATTATAEKTASLQSTELSKAEQEQVTKLKARDTEVRAHEQAHLATAGQYAKGGASYSFETGPDGVRYAVGGEVAIDASPVKGDPEATISKAQQIRAAALAPASPSSQDYRVAAAASKMETAARAEQSRSKSESSNSGEKTSTATNTTANITAKASAVNVAAAYQSQSMSLASATSRWNGYA